MHRLEKIGEKKCTCTLTHSIEKMPSRQYWNWSETTLCLLLIYTLICLHYWTLHLHWEKCCWESWSVRESRWAGESGWKSKVTLWAVWVPSQTTILLSRPLIPPRSQCQPLYDWLLWQAREAFWVGVLNPRVIWAVGEGAEGKEEEEERMYV